jgi:hypothetical protein
MLVLHEYRYSGVGIATPAPGTKIATCSAARVDLNPAFGPLTRDR